MATSAARLGLSASVWLSCSTASDSFAAIARATHRIERLARKLARKYESSQCPYLETHWEQSKGSAAIRLSFSSRRKRRSLFSLHRDEQPHNTGPIELSFCGENSSVRPAPRSSPQVIGIAFIKTDDLLSPSNFLAECTALDLSAAAVRFVASFRDTGGSWLTIMDVKQECAERHPNSVGRDG